MKIRRPQIQSGQVPHSLTWFALLPPAMLKRASVPGRNPQPAADQAPIKEARRGSEVLM